MQYLLTIAESQAMTVFNEIVQNSGEAKNLCLPMIVELDIYKSHKKSFGDYMNQIRQNMAADTNGEDISPNAPLILNYKYIVEGRMGSENISVPFNVKKMQVGVLFSETPKDGGSFRDSFSLDLVANNQIITRFKPVNFDFRDVN